MQRTYPGRLGREAWLRLSVGARCRIADRAEADLLELWRGCSKKPCRRAHACSGDQRCKSRPYAADFNNPNYGQPDFKSSFSYPEHLLLPAAIVMHLPFRREPAAAEAMVQACAAEAGAGAAAALRRIFRLQRRRRGWQGVQRG